MSAEQDQRPKSAASSKKSSEGQQRGHQLSDDGPVAAGAGAGGQQDAYQQLSDDNQPEGGEGAGSDAEKANKPKKENPLKKFIASLKSLNCTGKPSGKKNGEKNGSGQDDDDDNNTPNARPVSQSSLESKKVVTEKNAPQIDVSPAVEDNNKEDHDGKEDGHGEEKKQDGHNEKLSSPVDAHPPQLTTTAISATPPTL